MKTLILAAMTAATFLTGAANAAEKSSKCCCKTCACETCACTCGATCSGTCDKGCCKSCK